jgi:hypothetical protein
MKKSIVSSCVVALLLMTGMGGCEKKSGDAVVIGKDYVAAVKQGDEIKRRAGDQSRTMDRESPDAWQWPYDQSPRRSSAMGEIARKRSG